MGWIWIFFHLQFASFECVFGLIDRTKGRFNTKLLVLARLASLKNIVYFCFVNVPRIKNQVFQYFLFHIMNLRFVSKHCNIWCAYVRRLKTNKTMCFFLIYNQDFVEVVSSGILNIFFSWIFFADTFSLLRSFALLNIFLGTL